MSSNRRPRIGRQELQNLGISGDSLPAKHASGRKDLTANPGFTMLLSHHALQMPTITSSRPTVGHLSLPAVNTSMDAVPGDKEEKGTRRRKETKEVGILVANRPRTRGVRRRAQELLVEFNVCFRGLPAEVKDMIFALAVDSDCNKTPSLVIGLRSRQNHADEYLYKAALRAYYNQNTFAVTRKNLYTVNQDLKGAMPPAMWETIINLEIKHEYMKPGRTGFYQAFTHDAEGGESYYSPCAKCDYQTILLAKNVTSLHLDFGDSYHCIMHIIERTCKTAMENMQLQRLELTVSNILTRGNECWLEDVIEKINDVTRETGRLLSIGSHRYSAGPYTAHFASETWFWNSTRARQPLQWIEDWDKRSCDADRSSQVVVV